MEFNKIKHQEGSTPLEPSELFDLVPKTITTQEQLNAWEKRNIVLAEEWAHGKRGDIVSLSFVKTLHLKMFEHTWKWAGIFRRTDKNLGIDWKMIPTEIKKLCDDVSYQLTHSTFSDDEIAVRLHYRLVWIHPFVNGNGRHARLMADLLLASFGLPRFSWGSEDLTQTIGKRTLYINALRLADQGDFSAIISFARST